MVRVRECDTQMCVINDVLCAHRIAHVKYSSLTPDCNLIKAFEPHHPVKVKQAKLSGMLCVMQ